MEDKLKQFVEKFFLNLGAEVLQKNKSLVILKVPENFEKFYGKKSPYNFVFNANDETSKNEFIGQGNYLLKCMSNFLDEKGKTTLLKINFKINPEEEIRKKIKLNNCKIEKLIFKKKHNFFFRFTFHTTFQYLNEKEKLINDIYVYDGEVINGDLSNYEISEGRVSEVIIPDIKEPYDLAKGEVKQLARVKLESLSSELLIRLERELKRIENHFINENIELNAKLKGSTENLAKLEKIKNLSNSRDDFGHKINKKTIYSRSSDGQRQEGFFEKKAAEFEKDKLRAIEIEKQRHSLNINTRLFNTTLIYYPVFTYDCFLVNNVGKRIIEISFDPLLNDLKSLFCETCNEEIFEIYFCSSGHISCKKCFSQCHSCEKEYCKKCLGIVCEQCKKSICKKCAVRCFGCSKKVCHDHAIHDKISDKFYCSNCLRICERCSTKKEPVSFKKSQKTKGDVCETCFRKEMQEGILGLFD